MLVLPVEEIREIERAADQAGYRYAEMMQDAGSAVAERILSLLTEVPDARLTFLIGKGNNGGDGLVAAVKVAQARPGYLVRAYLTDARPDDPLVTATQDSGVHMASAEDDRDGRVIRHMAGSADLIVDALFGIGVRLPIRDAAQRTLRFTRQAISERAAARQARSVIDPTVAAQIARPKKQSILAVDCPSGLDMDTGDADKNTLPADETVTFIAAKPGLFLRDGVSLSGRVMIAPLRVGDFIDLSKRSGMRLLHNESVRSLLPPRPINSHKGTYGKALIIGGSSNYVGAVGLAAHAAGRIGTGLVTVAADREVCQSLQARFLSVTWLPHAIREIASAGFTEVIQAYTSTLIGVGLGGEADSRQAAVALLRSRSSASWVVDADALNAIAEYARGDLKLSAESVLTPHPAEAARLLDCETSVVQADRITAVQKLAERFDAVVVLKGAHSLIASPDGRIACSPFKTDALAKAGTGDVLAGIIVGLRAQGLTSFDAACVGVYIHGLAGTLAADQIGTGRSVLAENVIDAMPSALHQIASG